MSEEVENPEAKGGSSVVRSLLLIVAVVLGLGGGGFVGFMIVSPAVAERVVAAEPTKAEEGDGEDEKGDGEYGGASPAELHLIENLVVNPAGSDGLRFLLVTVAVDAASGSALTEVENREIELRDALLRLFGSKTVVELSDPTGRTALIEEVRLGLEEVIGEGKIRRVFVPQFVIQ